MVTISVVTVNAVWQLWGQFQIIFASLKIICCNDGLISNNLSSQVCDLTIMNWEYDGYEQHLLVSNGNVDTGSQYKDSGQWRLVDSYGCAMERQTKVGPWFSIKVQTLH